MESQTDVRTQLMQDYRRHDKDSGSPEVQVALLTQRINHLTDHLKLRRKDFAAQRGMRQMVGKRNRLLRYLAGRDEQRYRDLIARLGLRK